LGFELRVQLFDPRDEVERRATRTVRIVLVRGRDPEDAEHCIADELLDRSPVPVERRLTRRVVAELNLAKDLGVEPFAEGGGSDEIAEEQRDELAYGRSSRVGIESGAALR